MTVPGFLPAGVPGGRRCCDRPVRPSSHASRACPDPSLSGACMLQAWACRGRSSSYARRTSLSAALANCAASATGTASAGERARSGRSDVLLLVELPYSRLIAVYVRRRGNQDTSLRGPRSARPCLMPSPPATVITARLRIHSTHQRVTSIAAAYLHTQLRSHHHGSRVQAAAKVPRAGSAGAGAFAGLRCRTEVWMNESSSC